MKFPIRLPFNLIAVAGKAKGQRPALMDNIGRVYGDIVIDPFSRHSLPPFT
ncbi:hypothetical protein [Amaricoccus tamworthensis]|uniref:hypothetical protein n=1 Tax=Amaricoccus tamworthensis TaxID=57002 RepID=UPI003C7C5230